MTHTVRETGPWQRTLAIEVPVEEVEQQLEIVARRLQRQVALPGFRKGKVPLDKVRQQFAEHVEREFLESFIPEVTGRALGEAGLNPVVPPLVQNLRYTPGQPMAFDAVVELTPQVEAKDYRGLALRRRVRPVDESAVEAMLANLRDESAVFADVNRPAGRGDVVLLDSQRLDVNGRRLSGTRTKGARLLLGAPNLNPDLENGLLGAEEGQERTIAVNYPADYQPNPELAGKSVRYIVKVRKIQEKKLRELDDNFARDVFRLEGLEALRQRIRENLEGEDSVRVRRELEGLVTEELVRRNPFDLPPRLVEYMLDRVVHEQTEGRPVGKELHQQLEEHYRPGVERSLRREILLAAIARQENLSVSDEEIAAEIDRMAASDPRQASRVRARYQTADRRRALGDAMLERKAYDWLIGAANVVDEPLADPMVVPAGR
jgi:trigger factor